MVLDPGLLDQVVLVQFASVEDGGLTEQREHPLEVRNESLVLAEHVGVGPKWVIQRFRILEAAAAAHTGEVTNWARLAHELGFSDQAHLIRVFTDVVGTPPATYQREVTPERPAGGPGGGRRHTGRG